jgi:hypothetical protein
MFNNTILKYKNTLLGIGCMSGAFVSSFVSSFLILKSDNRFERNCLHIPIGFVGGLVSNFEINYGFIYFALIIIYQILEEVENLHKYNRDYSWYDIEGYTIGFTSCVYYLYLIKNRKITYELTNSENNI